MELAGAEARNAAIEVEREGARVRRVEGCDAAAAHEVDALDRGGRLEADAEHVFAFAGREQAAHRDAVDRDFEPGADAVGREGPARLQGGVQARAIESFGEEAGEAALACGDLREAGMAVVGIAAADEAEARAMAQDVADELALEGAGDGRGRVGGLAHAVDGGDLGDGLELGIGREMPVRRDGLAGGVVGEGQDGLAAQEGPELVRSIGRGVERGGDLEGVVEGEDVAMAVQPARPFVAGQRHEEAGGVVGADEGEDRGLAIGIFVEGIESPMVVVREGDRVEAGDVARITEVVVGGPGAIGEARMAMEIGPVESRFGSAHDDRRQIGMEARERAEAAHFEAERALDARSDEADAVGRAFGCEAVALADARGGLGRGDRQGADLEAGAGLTGGDRRFGPVGAVAGGVDERELDLEGLARGELGGRESEQLGRFVRQDVDEQTIGEPGALAIAVRIEADPQLRSALRITIDGRARRPRAVDDLDPLAPDERTAFDVERTGQLGGDESDGAGGFAGRLGGRRRPVGARRRDDAQGRVARRSRIRGLCAGPEPERIGQHEDRSALDDARRADLEADREALATRGRELRSRLPDAGRERDDTDRGHRLEPGAPRRVGGIIADLALGELAPMDLELGIGREGRMLLGPVRGQLEPGGFGKEGAFCDGLGADFGLGIGIRGSPLLRRESRIGLARVRRLAAGSGGEAEGAGDESSGGERCDAASFPVGPSAATSRRLGSPEPFCLYS